MRLAIAGAALLPSPEWTAAPLSDLERLGEAKVRDLMERFLDAVFVDPMIGFFFVGRQLGRIRELELRFAIEHLGGATALGAYNGRPMNEAHAPASVPPILGAHFDRRREILRETLEAGGVDEDIRMRWLAHNEAQRPLIVRGACR